MPRKRRRVQRGECRLVDGPSEVDTEGRKRDRRAGERRRRRGEKKKKGERKKWRKKWEVSYSSGWLAPYR